MNKTWLLFAFAAPLAAQQGFDFKLLDKLGANAKDSTNITLEGQSLKLAASFLGNDKDAASVKSLVSNLKAIYVRSWEFNKPGMYAAADVEPLRAWLRSPQWSKVVDVKEGNDNSEVFVRSGDADRIGGVVVITAEPRELTIVYIDGPISVDDVAKLGGNFHIPDTGVLNRGTVPRASENSKGKKNE